MVTNQKLVLICKTLQAAPGFDRAAAVQAEKEVEREAPTTVWDEMAASRAAVRRGVEKGKRLSVAESLEVHGIAVTALSVTGLLFGAVFSAFALAGVGSGADPLAISIAFGVQGMAAPIAAFLFAGAKTIRQMR